MKPRFDSCETERIDACVSVFNQNKGDSTTNPKFEPALLEQTMRHWQCVQLRGFSSGGEWGNLLVRGCGEEAAPRLPGSAVS